MKFGRDFKAYSFAYAMARLLRDTNLISSRKHEVELDEIERLNERLFEFDERLSTRISEDIRTLRKDLGSYLYALRSSLGRDGWVLYTEMLGGWPGKLKIRNFLAHSGFERNAVEIKKEDDRILLRYRRSEVKAVADLCRSGLK